MEDVGEDLVPRSSRFDFVVPSSSSSSFLKPVRWKISVIRFVSVRNSSLFRWKLYEN